MFSSFFDDCSVYATQQTPDYTWHTRIGAKALASRWMLAATAGAYSQVHSDAAGLCTYLHMLSGSKKWVVAKNWPSHPTVEESWEEEKMEWEPLLLEAGDDL